MTRGTVRAGALAALLAALAACGAQGEERKAQGNAAAAAAADEPQTVDIPQTVTAVAPGTTPMPERVAVVGLLNKRNGISRDLKLRPGQAVRDRDVIVRLRACETAAPWEVQKLTGAFVQLDVRNPQGQFQRVFSGWVYKETPSLNVVEHPVYDVWTKSCEMTHPAAAGEATPEPASNRSSAPKSGTSSSANPGSAPAARGSGDDSASANSAR
jgi:hypothetical protein